jgi:hypothetical protein
MRAPVYRSIEATNTFLGLAFPSEVLLVLAVFWVLMLLIPPGTALLGTLGTAGGLRLATFGRPPNWLQHVLLFQLRRAQSNGRFSAAARSRLQRRFPFAAYQILPTTLSSEPPDPMADGR